MCVSKLSHISTEVLKFAVTDFVTSDLTVGSHRVHPQQESGGTEQIGTVTQCTHTHTHLLLYVSGVSAGWLRSSVIPAH